MNREKGMMMRLTVLILAAATVCQYVAQSQIVDESGDVRRLAGMTRQRPSLIMRKDQSVLELQTEARPGIQESGAVEEFGEAIEDNSFFIEEAYNQEPGVVQHIFNATYFPKHDQNLALSFTQEWPFPDLTHQISFTVPYSVLQRGSVSGFGDVMINYRYQVFTSHDWAAFSPRLSILLPTGQESRGLGQGTVGLQGNLPFSKRWSDNIVTHFNVGMTVFPKSRVLRSDGNLATETLTTVALGGSFIWLTETGFNLMVEFLQTESNEFDEEGNLTHASETIVSPGMRFAVSFGSLQIVPGAAAPFSFGDGDVHAGVFLYLSFEHPF
jgi:hypothetical protein